MTRGGGGISLKTSLRQFTPAAIVSHDMRFLLVLWLAVGMVPGLGEVAETVVYLAMADHLAHSDADNGDLGEQGSEHGCGTTLHRCACCASQVVTAAVRVDVFGMTSGCCDQPVSNASLASLHEPTPPCRPPIAS